MSAPRYPKKVKKDGQMMCRGCGKPVPPERQTWCSRQCYETRCPQMVRWAVFQRDKGVCAICGRDTNAIAKALKELRWSDRTAYFEYHTKLKSLGFKPHQSLWEGDHIIPHSQGGEYVLENIRTLCVPCHKKETAKLAAQNALKRKIAKQPELILAGPESWNGERKR